MEFTMYRHGGLSQRGLYLAFLLLFLATDMSQQENVTTSDGCSEGTGPCTSDTDPATTLPTTQASSAHTTSVTDFTSSTSPDDEMVNHTSPTNVSPKIGDIWVSDTTTPASVNDSSSSSSVTDSPSSSLTSQLTPVLQASTSNVSTSVSTNDSLLAVTTVATMSNVTTATSVTNSTANATTDTTINITTATSITNATTGNNITTESSLPGEGSVLNSTTPLNLDMASNLSTAAPSINVTGIIIANTSGSGSSASFVVALSGWMGLPENTTDDNVTSPQTTPDYVSTSNSDTTTNNSSSAETTSPMSSTPYVDDLFSFDRYATEDMINTTLNTTSLPFNVEIGTEPDNVTNDVTVDSTTSVSHLPDIEQTTPHSTADMRLSQDHTTTAEVATTEDALRHINTSTEAPVLVNDTDTLVLPDENKHMVDRPPGGSLGGIEPTLPPVGSIPELETLTTPRPESPPVNTEVTPRPRVTVPVPDLPVELPNPDLLDPSVSESVPDSPWWHDAPENEVRREEKKEEGAVPSGDGQQDMLDKFQIILLVAPCLGALLAVIGGACAIRCATANYRKRRKLIHKIKKQRKEEERKQKEEERRRKEEKQKKKREAEGEKEDEGKKKPAKAELTEEDETSSHRHHSKSHPKRGHRDDHHHHNHHNR